LYRCFVEGAVTPPQPQMVQPAVTSPFQMAGPLAVSSRVVCTLFLY